MSVYRVDADLAYGSLVFARTPKTLANEEQQLRIWTKEYSDWSDHCETIGWIAPPIGHGSRNRARALPLDCIHLALGSRHDMLLSARAREALFPLLAPNGRFLPVRWEEHDYAIFECTAVADVADPDGMERTRSGFRVGSWYPVDRWSFHADRLETRRRSSLCRRMTPSGCTPTCSARPWRSTTCWASRSARSGRRRAIVLRMIGAQPDGC